MMAFWECGQGPCRHRRRQRAVPGDFRQAKKDTAAGVGDFEFRPLTEEEKKEFVNSLDAQGKQLLSELGPRRNSDALCREP
jgi:hypothetical protein